MPVCSGESSGLTANYVITECVPRETYTTDKAILLPLSSESSSPPPRGTYPHGSCVTFIRTVK